MCGIAGFVKQNRFIDSANLEREADVMVDALLHRGPDGKGIWHNSGTGLVLAHRRLSIQDLSANGKQPMKAKSQRYVITFNGEIYNFKVLAAELESLGHQFVGGSDTEVLLAAFDQWGIEESLLKLQGMFAFACWDKQEKTLSLCRDRLGEKPLYYGVVKHELVFASELKAIVRHCGFSNLSISRSSLSSYMRFGYVPSPYSIYEGVYKLLPGTLLKIPLSEIFDENYDLNKILNSAKAQAYWSVESVVKKRALIDSDSKENVQQLKEHLSSAVKQQMIADVSLGSFLSGGIDSTLVTAVAQSLSEKKINTFTIGFHEKNFNEAVYAKEIAKHLQTNHHELYVSSEDALNIIPRLGAMYDEPFADSSQIPTYIVSDFAKRHVTVCLSGDGGDELFCGYNRYMSADRVLNKTKNVPVMIKNLFSLVLSKVPPSQWDFVYQLTVGALKKNSRQSNVGNKLHKLAALLKKYNVIESYTYLMSFWDKPERLVKGGKEKFSLEMFMNTTLLDNFIEKAMFTDQLSYLPGDNLTKVDRASMAVSLETRLPLLDHKLFEYSWSLPLGMKYRDGKSKWLMRELLYQYVPRSLIERPKMGFSMPIASWLRNELYDWAESLLFSDSVSNEYLDQVYVRVTWDQHISGAYDHAHKLWAVLMFKLWYQNASQ